MGVCTPRCLLYPALPRGERENGGKRRRNRMNIEMSPTGLTRTDFLHCR